jgi:hypothetical protein
MPLDINLYKNRLTAYKIGTKDGQIDILKNQIIKDFKNNPSYFEVNINGILRDVIITEVNSLNNKPDEKLIIAKPSEDINIGDVIYWNSQNWLCIDTDLDKTVYSKGVIKYCNNTLKWQDENLNVIEMSCILLNKTSIYSDGIDETKYLNLSEDQILVIIPNNSNQAIYKVTKIDFLTQPGLINLTMKKDLLTSNDKVDLNIADYQGLVVSGIQGSDTIRLKNQETYTIDVDVTWSISNSNVSIISQDSRNITLKGEVMGNVTLIANDGVNQYIKEIVVIQSF